MTYVAVANAYVHSQDCTKSPYDRCYDVRGQIYNPWKNLGAGVRPAAGASVNGTCAKAVTQAGNTRSGTVSCGGSTSHGVTLDGAYPESQAYGYWGGSGPASYTNVNASTT
jgi:glycine/serine hydroxymethyltransferase